MNNERRLAKARELVQYLELGDERRADEIIQDLSDCSESELFQEVGRLTRELHEAINGFLLDGRIAELAHQEIPDAGERLNYVVNMTEESANIALGAVESGLPLADELTQLSGVMREVLAADEIPAERLDELQEFIKLVTDHSGQLHGKLSEVLVAQEFQDLTGQIIRQVISLVNDVEDKLVQLVRLSGAKATGTERHQEHLKGPAVPGLDENGSISDQDEVDELLSSLGF
ncbi:MAG: protein phosphatase CheZ [Candidatus Sedimenticola sp. PURPLELP]